MTYARTRLYPVKPFVDMYLLRYRPQPDLEQFIANPLTANWVFDQIRVSGTSRKRYLAEGIPEPLADKWAVKYLNLPAPAVWPEMIDHAIEDLAHLPDLPDWSPREEKLARRAARARQKRLQQQEADA